MNRRDLAVIRIVSTLSLGLACACATEARGQAAPPASPGAARAAAPAWSWPEKAKNLKVLPPDSPPEKLRAVMRGFSRSLGVRCSHCHVGKEGEPLSAYDFASDANPKKEVARGMYKMLGTINGQLREIQPNAEDRVNMWCHTCHRGLARPRTLAEEMGLTYDKAGADSAVALYRGLRARFIDAGAYDFREGAIEEVAVRAYGKKDWSGALAFCRLGVEMFPGSAGAHANLGEAALAAGDTTRAVASFERAVALDPKHASSAEALQRLRPARKPE